MSEIPSPTRRVTLSWQSEKDPKGDAYTTLQKLNYLTDTWTTAKHLGKLDLTATGFTTVGKSRIDFVFFGPVAEKLFEATQVEILDNYVDSIFLSDHRAVVADLKLLWYRQVDYGYYDLCLVSQNA